MKGITFIILCISLQITAQLNSILTSLINRAKHGIGKGM